MTRKGRNWRNIVEKGKELEMRGRIVEVGIPLWTRNGFKRHIQFKAGKMYVIDKMVYPDPRKGLVYIDQDAEHVMHFCWMERDGLGTKETDLTPDPYDASFVRVTKCTTGRVYLLKIGSARQNHFFWMQEPSEDKDAEICNTVNYLLNFPPLRLRFPQIACNFEMPQGLCLPPNEGNKVNADETNDDIEPVEGLSSNQYGNDEFGRMQELLLISTIRNPARNLSQHNPDVSETVSPEVSRPILENADLMRQLDDRERCASNPEEPIRSRTAMKTVDTAMKLRTLIPTLKNLGFSKRIIDAAVKGDWQIFINNLSREVYKLDCTETDTDCFLRLKSIIFSRDPHTYKTPEALRADIDKIVRSLAECNIENGIANVGSENGNTAGNQRSVDEGTGVSSNGNSIFNRVDEQERVQCNDVVETKKVSASEEEEQVPSTRSSESVSPHREVDQTKGVDVEVFQGVLLKTSSKSEGQTEEDSNTEVGRPPSNHLGINVVPKVVLEQEKESGNANWIASQTPSCATVSACGTQTDGPGYQSETSLRNRVSRKLLGKSTASLDGSQGPGSNPEHTKIVSSKQSGNRSFPFTFEESLNQPGCSSSWNPGQIGLKSDTRARLMRDGTTNTDCPTELLNYCRPSTSNHGSIDTVDIPSAGTASLNSRIYEPIEPAFILPHANTDEVVQCLTDTRDGTRAIAIQVVDDTGEIPAKSRSMSKNHEKMGNSSKQDQDLANSSTVQKCGDPNAGSHMPTRTDESCPSPALTKVRSSEDVVFVRGPYYDSACERNDSAKKKKISGRRLHQNDSGQMSSGVRKREGEPRLVQPASKKARISSPEPHPPPSFISPSPDQSEAVGRRHPCSKRSSNLLGTTNEEKDEAVPLRKRPNDLRPPDSNDDEPPTKRSRTSTVSGCSSRSNSGTSNTRKSDGSRTPTPTGSSSTPTPTGSSSTPTPTGSSSTPTPTGSSSTPTPTGSSSSEISRSTLRSPRALKQSNSKVSDAPSRKGGASHRYNLRSRSTEQETSPEVDSEQQTEPVRIREIKKAGPETRLRTISRTPRARTMSNRDRSQNTEPVLIEEISKPKDRKPPEPNKKPGA